MTLDDISRQIHIDHCKSSLCSFCKERGKTNVEKALKWTPESDTEPVLTWYRYDFIELYDKNASTYSSLKYGTEGKDISQVKKTISFLDRLDKESPHGAFKIFCFKITLKRILLFISKFPDSDHCSS